MHHTVDCLQLLWDLRLRSPRTSQCQGSLTEFRMVASSMRMLANSSAAAAVALTLVSS